MRLIQRLLCLGLFLLLISCSKWIPSASFSTSHSGEKPIDNVKAETTNAIVANESEKWQGKVNFGFSLTLLSCDAPKSPEKASPTNTQTPLITSTFNSQTSRQHLCFFKSHAGQPRYRSRLSKKYSSRTGCRIDHRLLPFLFDQRHATSSIRLFLFSFKYKEWRFTTGCRY